MPRLNMNLKTLDKQNCYQCMPFNASFSSNRKKIIQRETLFNNCMKIQSIVWNSLTMKWKFSTMYDFFLSANFLLNDEKLYNSLNKLSHGTQEINFDVAKT